MSTLQLRCFQPEPPSNHSNPSASGRQRKRKTQTLGMRGTGSLELTIEKVSGTRALYSATKGLLPTRGAPAGEGTACAEARWRVEK